MPPSFEKILPVSLVSPGGFDRLSMVVGVVHLPRFTGWSGMCKLHPWFQLHVGCHHVDRSPSLSSCHLPSQGFPFCFGRWNQHLSLVHLATWQPHPRSCLGLAQVGEGFRLGIDRRETIRNETKNKNKKKRRKKKSGGRISTLGYVGRIATRNETRTCAWEFKATSTSSWIAEEDTRRRTGTADIVDPCRRKEIDRIHNQTQPFPTNQGEKKKRDEGTCAHHT